MVEQPNERRWNVAVKAVGRDLKALLEEKPEDMDRQGTQALLLNVAVNKVGSRLRIKRPGPPQAEPIYLPCGDKTLNLAHRALQHTG